MLCNVCQKKVATIHLTEIVDEKIVELHVCQDCAQVKGGLAKDSDISNFLGAFADERVDESGRKIQCSNCGLTYYDFKKKGRLGCKNCYLTFKPLLLPLLKRIHSAVQHQGKRPRAGRGDIQGHFSLKDLKDKLKQAIELEEYEKAAKLRDQIKKIERGAGS